MDGSASTSLAERTRLQISRAFVNRTANEANAQIEMFEQLLNLSFNVQPPPEKQPKPLDTASSFVDDSSVNSDDTDVAPLEEEKEDETEDTVATLVQTASLITENPLELASDQTLTETQSDNGALSAADPDATQVNTQVTATAIETSTGGQVSAQLDEQVVVKDTQVTDPTINTETNVAESTLDVSVSEVRIDSDKSSNKKATPTATRIDDAKADQSPELLTRNKTEANENTVSKAQHEIAIQPEAANAQQDDRSDGKGDRREKWFERKSDAIDVSAMERQNDPNIAKAAEIMGLATIEASNASSHTTTPQENATREPLVTPATTSPAALPIALSAVSQNSTIALSQTPTQSSTSSTETTTAISSAPSRAVGNQTSKAGSKDKATEPSLSQQERVRVIQRIARSFNRISSEGGSINLRLHPEHLGSVSVQVRLEGRSLSARLSTETVAARDAIMQDLPALRQRLADQGFDVTKFQVDVAGNGADASFAQSNGQPQFGQSENRSSGSHTDYRRVAANREARAATTRQIPPATNLSWHSGAGIDLQA